jgi:hypothetical protein
MKDIIELLAPSPAEPDLEWASETLQRIKASKVPRRRRRRFIVAGVVAGAVLGGGVAVAQSALAPDSVKKSIGQLQKHAGIRSTTEPVKIADIHLSDGTRWQVWRGLNDHAGSCWSAGDPGTGPVERDFGLTSATCSWMPEGGDQNDKGMLGDFSMFDFYDRNERTGLPLVFGQVVDPKVKAVRVVGPGFDKTVTPDPHTGGFGFELPFATAHHKKGYLFDGVKVQFLDKDGDVVHQGGE